MGSASSSVPGVSSDGVEREVSVDRSLRGRLRATIDSWRDRVRRFFRSDDRSADERSSSAAQQTTLDLERFPDRSYPLTYPDRNLDGLNTPDVVSIETADGIRLSVPDNPDAAIVSDLWVPVEE